MLLAMVHVMVPNSAAETGTLRRIAQSLMLLVTAAVPWVLVIGYFAVEHRFGSFYECVIEFNRSYAGSMPRNLIRGLVPPRTFRDIPSAMPYLFLLAGLGVVTFCSRRGLPARPWLLWLAYAIGTFAAVHLPGRNHPHYHQLWLPPLVVAAGWSVVMLGRLFAVEPEHFRWGIATFFPCLLGLAALIPPILEERRNQFSLTSQDVAWAKYGREESLLTASREYGRKLAQVLLPDERLYFWGHGGCVMFYSQRRPATSICFTLPFFGNAISARLVARTLAELQATPPELVLLGGKPDPLLLSPSTRKDEPPDAFDKDRNVITSWIEENYSPNPSLNASFAAAYVRKGGALEARLGVASK